MATENARRRVREPESTTAKSTPQTNGILQDQSAKEANPGLLLELARLLGFTSWFMCCCFCITFTQLAGCWLYFVDKDYYYAYMAMSKQSFGIFVTVITQWFSPTLIRVTGDASVQGQMRKTKDGLIELDFPERVILISNHQVYTDWIYLWWAAYTARMHGHLYIILKESLKYIPVLSPGILFYGFIFMARKWDSDKTRMHYRFQKLQEQHSGPMSGSASLDPMWLLLFPEGTNLSPNTRKSSVKWAEKQGIPDMRHQLLPRSTGFEFCLQELHKTVEWVYDCTVAYEGVPKGGYAPEYFTLRSTYFQGRPPKSVNMHWRRFAVRDIPFENHDKFDAWLLERWREKDELLEQFYNTGKFPMDAGKDGKDGEPIKTEVKVRQLYEVAQIFIVLLALAMVANVLVKLFEMLF